METPIINFIKENKVATVCCTDGKNNPYCFQCFYAFDEKNRLLFFKSSAGAYHVELMSANHSVAGTIQAQKIDLLTLKGIQFTGQLLTNEILYAISPGQFYHKRFPFAVARPGKVWCIELTMVKMTDNTNVLGKKLKWEREVH